MTPRLNCVRRRWCLPQPAQNAKHRWSERRAIFLFHRHLDEVGLGEAAPLPGYSKETFEEANQALRDIDEARVSNWLEEVLGELRHISTRDPAAGDSEISTADAPHLERRALQWWCDRLQVLPFCTQIPSARFALETALLDWIARHLGISLASLLVHRFRRRSVAEVDARLPVAALVPPASTGETFRQELVERSLDQGARTLKFKISPATLDEDALWVRHLHRQLKGTCRFRLDANGALSWSQFQRFAANLSDVPIEFIEEPIKLIEDPHVPLDSRWGKSGPQSRLEALHTTALHMPIALDESLQHSDIDGLQVLLEREKVAFLVLKPMALGGFSACLRLALSAQRFLRSSQFRWVISHLFSSAVAQVASSELAFALFWATSLPAETKSACRADSITAQGLGPHPALPKPYREDFFIRPVLGRGHGVSLASAIATECLIDEAGS